MRLLIFCLMICCTGAAVADGFRPPVKLAASCRWQEKRSCDDRRQFCLGTPNANHWVCCSQYVSCLKDIECPTSGMRCEP